MLRIVPVITAALLCACSTSHTYSTKDGSATVTKDGADAGSVHIAGKEGASVDINSGKPITDYPADAPIYQGKSVMDIKAEEKHSRVVAIETPDAMEKVADYYKKGLAEKGWKTESTVATEQTTMYIAAKGNRQLTVTISGGSDGRNRSISQTITEK